MGLVLLVRRRFRPRVTGREACQYGGGDTYCFYGLAFGERLENATRMKTAHYPHVKAHFIEPMLALAVKETSQQGPSGPTGLDSTATELLGLKSGDTARLYSRNGKDLSGRFPSVTRALEALPHETLIGRRSRRGRRERPAVIQQPAELESGACLLCIRSANARRRGSDAAPA